MGCEVFEVRRAFMIPCLLFGFYYSLGISCVETTYMWRTGEPGSGRRVIYRDFVGDN